jgi:hypothetical protein
MKKVEKNLSNKKFNEMTNFINERANWIELTKIAINSRLDISCLIEEGINKNFIDTNSANQFYEIAGSFINR